MRAPSELNFSGYFRNSTTSWSSVLASSTPATSLNVTTVLLPRNIRARDLPNERAWLLVPWAWRIMKKMKPPMTSSGRSPVSSRPIQLVSGAGRGSKIGASTLLPSAALAMSCETWVRMLAIVTVYSGWSAAPPLRSTLSVSPCCTTFSTLPPATSSRNEPGPE
jgi:hypothetical protein